MDTTSPKMIESEPPEDGQPVEVSSEALLVAVANHRDRAAFEQLFERFARRVYGLGMRLTGNEQLCKDLVQEVMLVVWRNASRFNMDRGSAQNWIFAVARNKCIDMIRKRSRQPVLLKADEIWPEDLTDTEFGKAQDPATLSLEVEEVRRLGAKLPPLQWQAIELVYSQDRTQEEAANILAIPLGTLKSRIRLGLIKLRDLIGESNG